MKAILSTELVAGLVAAVALAGCVEKRFDVELVVTRAEAVDGVLQYNYFTDVDALDGSIASGKSAVSGLAVDLAAETIVFEAEVLGSTPGFGRSAVLTIPDGGTLQVPVLVAPTVPGLISSTPEDLGGDACVAVDENGVVFMMGGSASTHSGSVFDDAFTVRNFGTSYPTGVADPGCVAHAGKVAVVASLDTVIVTDVAGNETVVDVNGLDTFAGAVAAPRSDGSFWLVDGDNDVFFVDTASGTSAIGTATGARNGVEVTANDSLVALIGGEVIYVDSTGLRSLGNAQALGRRLAQVFVIDGETLSVVANAATDVVGSVDDVVDSFVVLGDDSVVGLSASRLVGAEAPRRYTRIVGLPGDTVLLFGAAGAGFDGFSRR